MLARGLGIDQSVVFRDYIPDGLLPDYYRIADVFALSSRYEPFGMTAVEAMACGTPVFCSNASSLPEVAGDAALMVDPFDIDGLVEAMARTLEDADLRQQMIAKGLAQAARFTWAESAQQLLSVFGAL